MSLGDCFAALAMTLDGRRVTAYVDSAPRCDWPSLLRSDALVSTMPVPLGA